MSCRKHLCRVLEKTIPIGETRLDPRAFLFFTALKRGHILIAHTVGDSPNEEFSKNAQNYRDDHAAKMFLTKSNKTDGTLPGSVTNPSKFQLENVFPGKVPFGHWPLARRATDVHTTCTVKATSRPNRTQPRTSGPNIGLWKNEIQVNNLSKMFKQIEYSLFYFFQVHKHDAFFVIV